MKQLVSRSITDMIDGYGNTGCNKLTPSESKYCAVHLPQGRKPAGATAALAADVTAVMLIALRCRDIWEKTIYMEKQDTSVMLAELWRLTASIHS